MGGKRFPVILQLVLLAMLLAGCDWLNQQTKHNTNASEISAAQAASTSNVAVSSGEQDIDSHPGKALHDANCISCHDTGKYQSAALQVADFPALLAQVRRCDANLNPRLANDDLVQIADYLNQAFYRYDKQ